MLIPIDQYKKSAPRQQTFGKLKPLAPKPARVAQAVQQAAALIPLTTTPKTMGDGYASNVPQWMKSVDQGLKKFSKSAENVPRFDFAEKIQNPIGRFAASVPQSILNTPSDFVKGAFRGYGEEVTPSAVMKRAGEAVNVGLNVASVPGVGSVVKQGATQGLKQGAIQGAKSGAGFGAAYGAASGIQEGGNTGEQLKNAIKQTLAGGTIGGITGGILGAGGAAFGKLRPLPKKEAIGASSRAANRTGLALLPDRSPLPETPATSRITPLPSRTAPPEAVLPTKFQKSLSYTGGVAPKAEKVNPLLQEAGKYKSAEEFVFNTKTLFRGTNDEGANLLKAGHIPREGLSVTLDPSVAKKYAASRGLAGYTIEKNLIPGAKVISLEDVPNAVRSSGEGTDFAGKAAIWARKQGYDVLDMSKGNEGEMRILNKDVLKTKSQLTDLYNKAQGGVAEAIEKIKDPLKPTGKERGFIESVKNSPEVSQDIASRVQGSYEPTTNKAGLEKAQRTIFDNITEAERIAKDDVGAEGGLMNTELIKHYDSIAQKAKQAGDEATFNKAMDKAVEVAESRAKNLTETAQNLQAASTISKLSPEGLLHYINKVSKDIGSPVKLSNDQTYDFMRRAGEIQNILDPREKAFKTFDLIDDLAEAMPKGQSDNLLNALNLPRAIMSTGDLSAPLRQGIFSAARNPITFGKNFGNMFKYAFSEDAYRGLKADIITSPNYNLYVKHGLPLTDVSAGLTGREEAFMSNLAEKIPVFGKLAKGSNRAYTGFLNKMRVDLFDDFVNTAKLNGIKDQKYFDDAAKFVGAATGRGNLIKTLEGSAPALNSIFFSPRLMASRISLINPAFYMKLEPTVRKEALKSLGAFVGTGMSILALAKANGADVSSDPRSADFGKIKMGNTRYDIWGGFQQYARFIGQFSTGEKVSTITGRETTLGQGYNAPTRESITGDFFQSKEAPIASFVNRFMEGEKYGEKFNAPAEVLDRFLPMLAGDAFDLYKEYGAKGVVGAVPGFFGVGSQTYGDQIPTMGTTEANNPTIKWRTQPGLGETILNSVTGKEVSTLPKDQWKALYEERKQEQIRQAEVDKVKAVVLISGQPQYVGDTKVYLENGVVKTKKESKDKRLPLKDQLLYDEIQKRKTNPFYQ